MTTKTDEKDGTIVPFRVLPPAPVPDPAANEPSKVLIDFLTEMLEAAMAGKLRGMTYVAADDTGKCRWGLVGRVGGFSMAGALAAAAHELNEINLDDAADAEFED